jgi:formylglycine-generating enzyme required for sulfatase activity
VLDDFIPCTADSCDEAADKVVHAPDNSACDDGLTCTTDACDPGEGCVNTPEAGYVVVDGACLVACGSTACPELSGYDVTCNAEAHCEYSIKGTTGWKKYDVWVYVPEGSFTMGSPWSEAGHQSSEDPNHTVTFAEGFLIGKYEITVAQYEACMSASPATCTAPSTADWNGDGWGTNSSANGRSDHPQNGLTWQQAKDFCAWAAPQGRLLSEAEWEYAASGPVHRKYPCGNTPEPTCANNTAVFDEDGSGSKPWGCNPCTASGCSGTSPAGSKTAGASWSGALDMSGNVWEWCEDWWHWDYTGAPADGSAWVLPDEVTGSSRVERGGSFRDAASCLRSSARNYDTPSYRYAASGGRCLRPLP